MQSLRKAASMVEILAIFLAEVSKIHGLQITSNVNLQPNPIDYRNLPLIF